MIPFRRTPVLAALICTGYSCLPLADAPQPDRLAVVTPVYLDSGFSEGERHSIEAALDEWNYALHGARIFALAGIVQHPGARVDLPRSALTIDAETPPPPIYLPSGTIGWVTEIGSSDVHLLPDGRTKETAMHEIGHSLGAWHISGTLMAAYRGHAPCVDAKTLRQVALAQRLAPETLRVTCQ